MFIDGKKVRQLREALGQSRAQVAVHCDMSADWVAKMEGVERFNINIHIARALAKAVGTTVHGIEARGPQTATTEECI